LRTVPDLVGHDLRQAQGIVKRQGLELIANCEQGIITWQSPLPGRKVLGGGKIAVVIKADEADSARMVDLTGLSMRTAMSLLSQLGHKYDIKGSGVVESQEPAPGEILPEGTRCLLICGKGLVDADSTEEIN
jgi:stage V sporulation protein D (sporulation-specific penicillin-binding protein)